MSRRDQQRVRVLVDLAEDRLTRAEAAEAIGVSVRQLSRIQARFRATGPTGIIHGNRGRAPFNKCSPELVAEVLRLSREKYAGFNQVHFTEMLERDEQILLSRMTVRRLLAAHGVSAPRPQKRSRHRRHRQRRAQAGAMVQADGSDHDWLEGRGPRLTLVGAVDDATNRIWAVFRLAEDTHGYLELLDTIIRTAGVPCAFYTDRTTLMLGTRRTPDRVASGTIHYATHLTRVLDGLDISLIRARSPEAKGRIERTWKTLQDRLVSELRAKDVRTLEGARAILKNHLAFHNRNYERQPANPEPAWRSLPEGTSLEDLLSWSYSRVVTNANCVSVDGLRLQLDLPVGDPGWAQRRVWVHRRLDGSWFATYLDNSVPAIPITDTPRFAAA